LYLTHPNLIDYFVIDIEADSLYPSKVWCIVVQNAATKQVWKFYGNGFYNTFRQFVRDNPRAYWVGHNILSYDVPSLNRLLDAGISFDRCIDTLVLSILYHPKMPGGHSLEAYGERFKVPKDLFNDFSRFSEPLLDRCVVDVALNLRLFSTLTKKMRAVGFSEKSCWLEHRIRVIINKQQQNGFKFDEQAATGLLAELRQKEQQLAVGIRELFPPVLTEVYHYAKRERADGTPTANYQRHIEQYPKIVDDDDGPGYTAYDWEVFNIGSPKQRLEKLLTLGFVPTKLTKAGKPSIDEDSLVEFAKEIGNDQVQAIADWLVANARGNMVTTWLDAVADDGCIHGRVNSCGAASRRMTHSGPNTANIPSNEATYGEVCRSLWTARMGRVLVGYDAKSAQMRCFAHYLPNPADGERFYTDGRDPHQENADLIGIKRKPIKNVFYANMFGAGPPKLATTAGRQGSRRELVEFGEWIRAELYRVTPGLEALTKEAQAEFEQSAEGWMRCLDGGYVRCPSKNAALNYRIQPAEAVLMKTASVFIHDRAIERGLDHLKVGDIHDEGQHDVDPRCAQEFGQLCVQAVRDAGEEYNLRVPFDGDFKVGPTWAQTH
jgi:DNA polymerase-1